MGIRTHIRTTRPRLKVAKHWRWRVIIINPLGFIDWDDYKYPEQVIPGTHMMLDRLKETHAETRA